MKMRIEVEVEVPEDTLIATVKDVVVDNLESEGYYVTSLSASNGSEHFSVRGKDAKATQ